MQIARQIFQEMQNGCTARHLDFLLNDECEAKKGSIEAVRKLFFAISSDERLKHNRVTYSTMLACESKSKNGDVERARSLFQEMEEEGVARDTIAYNTMIACEYKKGSVENARWLFQQMEDDNSARPNQ